MEEFFVWTEKEYGLNVRDMDNEHKILIDKMNTLHKAWLAKAPKDSLVKLAKELGSYTHSHFAHEEKYMESINYDGIETHKIIHKRLLTTFGDYVKKLEANGALDDEFFLFLKNWLASHIRGIDMKYAKGKSSFAS